MAKKQKPTQIDLSDYDPMVLGSQVILGIKAFREQGMSEEDAKTKLFNNLQTYVADLKKYCRLEK